MKKQALIRADGNLTEAGRLGEIGIDTICAYVAAGDSLQSWCRVNNYNPRIVLDWINADVARATDYAQAREDRAEAVFEALDQLSADALLTDSPVTVAAFRLKSDIIKWKLARMSPKRYGDRLDIGGVAGAPLVTILDFSGRSGKTSTVSGGNE